MNALNNIEYLAGKKNILVKTLSPYDKIVCEFFDNLSIELSKNIIAQKFTDVISFAFWCRKN